MKRDQLWDQLRQVRALAFLARSANPIGWNGKGNGSVLVQSVNDTTMTFTEQGVWLSQDGRYLHFRNVFRWSKSGDGLRLEHLRFGEDRPVHLFDLAQVGDGEWQSASPHLCSEDCYTARLMGHEDRLILQWTVNGPRKQESIEYLYSWQEGADRLLLVAVAP